MSAGRLIVCPTPIGNLEDVTLRVLAALREADIVACEDTRRSARAARPLRGRREASSATTSTTSAQRAGELVAKMRDGAVVALVSDAGTPLVSDPGFVLVQACVAAGLAVEVLPGPSAALAALVASALPADRWRFAGFLPRKRSALERSSRRRRRWSRSSRRSAWPSSLKVLAELDPERPVAVVPRADQDPRGGGARHRRRAGGAVRARTLRAARSRSSSVARRRCVDEIGPAFDALRRLVEAGAKPRPAASVVSELTGVPANRLYRALTAG